mgnify:CR=1 FL=1
MNKENKTKTNLKPLIDSIDFEPEYAELMFKEDALFKTALTVLKVFCDKNSINRNSMKVNNEILVKIARKMTNQKIKEDNRLGLSACQRALLDIHKDKKRKVINLDLL